MFISLCPEHDLIHEHRGHISQVSSKCSVASEVPCCTTAKDTPVTMSREAKDVSWQGQTAHCPATTASEKPSAWLPCCLMTCSFTLKRVSS